jgi:hypothetical protein
MTNGKVGGTPTERSDLPALLTAFLGRLCRSAQPGTSRFDAESIGESRSSVCSLLLPGLFYLPLTSAVL